MPWKYEPRRRRYENGSKTNDLFWYWWGAILSNSGVSGESQAIENNRRHPRVTMGDWKFISNKRKKKSEKVLSYFSGAKGSKRRRTSNPEPLISKQKILRKPYVSYSFGENQEISHPYLNKTPSKITWYPVEITQSILSFLSLNKGRIFHAFFQKNKKNMPW